jgi:hypothetical protein
MRSSKANPQSWSHRQALTVGRIWIEVRRGFWLGKETKRARGRINVHASPGTVKISWWCAQNFSCPRVSLNPLLMTTPFVSSLVFPIPSF